jgi:hypothetical protein
MPVSPYISGKYRDMTPSRCEGKIYDDEGYSESGFAKKRKSRANAQGVGRPFL